MPTVVDYVSPPLTFGRRGNIPPCPAGLLFPSRRRVGDRKNNDRPSIYLLWALRNEEANGFQIFERKRGRTKTSTLSRYAPKNAFIPRDIGKC